MPPPIWTQFNCYGVLGAAPSASPVDIRAAFRLKSKVTHPDSGGSHEGHVRVNLAYEVLSDPVDRQLHDKYWASRSVHPPTATPQADTYSRPSDRTAPQPQPRPPSSPRGEAASAFDALYRRVRSEIDQRTQRLNAQRAQRVSSLFTQFEAQLNQARATRNTLLIGASVTTLLALMLANSGLPWTWIIAIIAWFAFANSTSGPHFGSTRVSPGDPSWRQKATSAAGLEADREIKSSVDSLQQSLSTVASLQQLLTRSSSFDDSEEHVARQITATLFLLGYTPTSFDREGRMLVLTDGEERILVRYRHRAGAPTNVSYVKRMTETMAARGISRGYLFCTPGLTGNGAQAAQAHRIKWYSLETMNQWITDTARGPYDGPKGDILSQLKALMSFLAQISISISGPSYRRRRRYY